MTKVYVLNYGVYGYDSHQFTTGVYSSEAKALEQVEPGRVPYHEARYGQYYYVIEEFDLDD